VNPWREVRHIEMQDGARGGRMFCLTLACGHLKFVPVRPQNLTRALMHRKFKVQTAPRRCRCWHCGLTANPPSAGSEGK